MTAQEVQTWLRQRPFQPFRIGMDSGETVDVMHPELALLMATGALYVFNPTNDELADAAGLEAVCEVRSISTLRPLAASASQESG